MEIPTYFDPSQEDSLRKHLNNLTFILHLQHKKNKRTLIDLNKNLIIQLYQLLDLLAIFLENFNNISKSTEKFWISYTGVKTAIRLPIVHIMVIFIVHSLLNYPGKHQI